MYLVYAHGRSGSTQLVRALRRAVGGELVRDEPFKQRNAESWGYNLSVRDNIEDYLRWLGAPYLKHLWSDMRPKQNRALVSSPLLQGVIFLYRRNIFEYAISMVAASLTKEWHGSKAEFGAPMPLSSVEHAISVITETIPSNSRLVKESITCPLLCVSYEDLYSSSAVVRDQTAVSVLDALGVERNVQSLKNLLSFFNPDKKYKGREYYLSKFTNFREVEERFSDSSTYFSDHPDQAPEYIFGTSLQSQSVFPT